MTQAPLLKKTLRQMLAVLESERQALAALDLDAITGAAQDKNGLCHVLGDGAEGPAPLDAECRALLDAARRQNEVNRQIRNLVAANVAARLDALTGAAPLYRNGAAYSIARR